MSAIVPYPSSGVAPLGRRSFVLPCSKNTEVVPEKHNSASCEDQGGAHGGSTPGAREGASGTRSADGCLPRIVQDRGHLVQLIVHTGDLLQLIEGGLGVVHARGRRVDLAAQEVGVLPVGRQLDERLDLRFHPVELQGGELAVLHGLLVIVETLVRDRRALFERSDHAVVAAAFCVGQALLEIVAALGQLLDGGQAEKPQQAGLLPGQTEQEHTSELQSRLHLVCRLLLEKKKKKTRRT